MCLVSYWNTAPVFIVCCAVTVFSVKWKIKEGMFSQTLNLKKKMFLKVVVR
jgi:hypothetical protein